MRILTMSQSGTALSARYHSLLVKLVQSPVGSSGGVTRFRATPLDVLKKACGFLPSVSFIFTRFRLSLNHNIVNMFY